MTAQNGAAAVQAQLTTLLGASGGLNPQGKQALMGIFDHFESNLAELRQRIAELRPDEGLRESVQAAITELGEAVAETARAADDITTAANKVEQLSRRAQGNLGPELVRASSRIYESCAFQDITGQRINKAAAILTQVDSLLVSLAQLPASGAPRAQAERDPSKSLLNGPQLSAAAQSQADIDKLFDSI